MTPQERARKRKFEALYADVRKCSHYRQEMGSASDLLIAMETPAAKRARPTLGEKLNGWAKKWHWPAHSWAKKPELRSRTGGGKNGIAATKDALDDIHRHLQ